MAVSGFGRLPAAVGLDCGWNLVGKLAFWAMLSEQLRMLPVALSRIVGIGDYSCVVVGKARMTLRESADADQERRRAQVKMGRCRPRNLLPPHLNYSAGTGVKSAIHYEFGDLSVHCRCRCC